MPPSNEERRPGIADVASRAGVSISTVSLALNAPTRLAPATLERIEAAIIELGFVPNDAARALARGRSDTVGLVLLDIADAESIDLMRGAEAELRQRGIRLLLAEAGGDESRAADHVTYFERARFDGVLIATAGMLIRPIHRPAVWIGAGPSESSCTVELSPDATAWPKGTRPGWMVGRAAAAALLDDITTPGHVHRHVVVTPQWAGPEGPTH